MMSVQSYPTVASPLLIPVNESHTLLNRSVSKGSTSRGGELQSVSYSSESFASLFDSIDEIEGKIQKVYKKAKEDSDDGDVDVIHLVSLLEYLGFSNSGARVEWGDIVTPKIAGSVIGKNSSCTNANVSVPWEMGIKASGFYLNNITKTAGWKWLVGRAKSENGCDLTYEDITTILAVTTALITHGSTYNAFQCIPIKQLWTDELASRLNNMSLPHKQEKTINAITTFLGAIYSNESTSEDTKGSVAYYGDNSSASSAIKQFAKKIDFSYFAK